MQIICVDDHPVLLEGLVNTVQHLVKNANVQGFTKAEEALSIIEDDDQLAGAIALAQKAAARIKPGEDMRKASSRIAAMLARRGYSWDIAKEAIRQALSDEVVNFD